MFRPWVRVTLYVEVMVTAYAAVELLGWVNGQWGALILMRSKP